MVFSCVSSFAKIQDSTLMQETMLVSLAVAYCVYTAPTAMTLRSMLQTRAGYRWPLLLSQRYMSVHNCVLWSACICHIHYIWSVWCFFFFFVPSPSPSPRPQGLLALEGELTPILVQMVKSANMNGLLDSDSDSLTDCQQRVKARLHEIMQKDQDFTGEDYQKVQHIFLPLAFPFIQV